MAPNGAGWPGFAGARNGSGWWGWPSPSWSVRWWGGATPSANGPTAIPYNMETGTNGARHTHTIR